MKRVLVVGASRGIGLEFVRQWRAEGWAVTATARSDEGLAEISTLGARALRLDVAGADGAAALAWPIDGEAFDAVVLNAGVYGPRTQGLQAPTQTEFDEVMHTNVLGAMRVLPQVVEVLAPGARLAVISSRMGSVGLRSGTAGWLYRASKAALNSVLKDASLVLQGRAVCVAFHPGWVRTDMGGAGADLDVATSVADMRRTLAGLSAADNGGFFNHDGKPLAW
ncbi:SDR family oxidoreductase [Rubrivivax sp. A210]|uniref:SDR family oxidoreductase n=1 Tax=Rubrivivax sp. A210 TaxID=2772301 RepID=UPI001919E9BC|nr:SDR family oxidoreductase [Rubrivivax sp. A210]CAD5374092.1 SDR family oxidoreductase [Rubrivivax sp. A210]